MLKSLYACTLWLFSYLLCIIYIYIGVLSSICTFILSIAPAAAAICSSVLLLFSGSLSVARFKSSWMIT